MAAGLGQFPAPQGLGSPIDASSFPRQQQTAESKTSQEEAQYVEQAPGDERCADCTMFRPPDQCTAVEGVINPEGWCSYFEAKQDAA